MAENQLPTEGINRLVLSTVADSSPRDAVRDVEKKLVEMGISEYAIDAFPGSYAIGENFLKHIIFMGCSPAIELEVPAEPGSIDKIDFTFIRMSHNTKNAKPVPYYGKALDRIQQIPRCYYCRKPVTDTLETIHSLLKQSPDTIACQKCHQRCDVYQLDWRKQNGWGNMFIEVLNVFPSEAVPTDGFLLTLERVTNSKWKFFYTSHDMQCLF